MIHSVLEMDKSEYLTREKFQDNLPWAFGQQTDTFFGDATIGTMTAGDCLRYESSDLKALSLDDESQRSTIIFERTDPHLRQLYLDLKNLRVRLRSLIAVRSQEFKDAWNLEKNKPDVVTMATRWSRIEEGWEFRKEIARFEKTGETKLETRWVTLKPRKIWYWKTYPTRVKVSGQWRVIKQRRLESKIVEPKVQRVVGVPVRRKVVIRPAGQYKKWRKVSEQYTRYAWDVIRARYQKVRREIEAKYLPRQIEIENEIRSIQLRIRNSLEKPKKMLAYTTSGCVADPVSTKVSVPLTKVDYSDVLGETIHGPETGSLRLLTNAPWHLWTLFNGRTWKSDWWIRIEPYGDGTGHVTGVRGGQHGLAVYSSLTPVFQVGNYPESIQALITNLQTPRQFRPQISSSQPATLPVRGDQIVVTNGQTPLNPANMRDDAKLGSDVAMFENLTDRSDYTFHYIRSLAEAQENKELITQLKSGLTANGKKFVVSPSKFFQWLKRKSVAELRRFASSPVHKMFRTGAQKLAGLYLLEKFAIEPTLADANTLINGCFDYLTVVRKHLQKLLTESGIPSSTIYHARKRFRADDCSYQGRFDTAEMPQGIWDRYKSIELSLNVTIKAELNVTGYYWGSHRDACQNLLASIPHGNGVAVGREPIRLDLLFGDDISVDLSSLAGESTSLRTTVDQPGKRRNFQCGTTFQDAALTRSLPWAWGPSEWCEIGNHTENSTFLPVKLSTLAPYETNPALLWFNGCTELGDSRRTVAENLSELLPVDGALPVPIVAKNEVHGVIFGQYNAQDLLRLVGIQDESAYHSDEASVVRLLRLTEDVLENFFKSADLVFTLWQLYPLSFVFDWLSNSNDIAHRINALFQGRVIDTMPRSRYGSWVTKKIELFAGVPKYVCYDTSVWRYYSDFRVIPTASQSACFLAPLEENLNYVWRFKPETGKTVSINPSGLKKVIRGPYTTDALSILRESIPLLQIKLDSGKLTTLAAMLLG